MDRKSIRIQAIVSGKVQGVNFRNSTRARARSLGVHGVVRNLPDGRVAVTAEGGREVIEELVVFLHQGPSSAEVERVEVEYAEPLGDFQSFEIER